MNTIKKNLSNYIREQKVEIVYNVLNFIESEKPNLINEEMMNEITTFINNNINIKQKIPRTLYKKPPHQPSIYNLFLKDSYQDIKQHNPNMSHQEVIKKISELWQEHPFALFLKNNMFKVRNYMVNKQKGETVTNQDLFNKLKSQYNKQTIQ